MRLIIKKLFIIAAMPALQVFADDTSQLQERLNPLIAPELDTIAIDYNDFPSVRLANNHIALNGDDWTALAEKYAAAAQGKGRFSVVYLGDSHVQADFGGNVLRQRLTACGGNAGRGIISPLKLAGTNQPTDYGIGLASPYVASTLMRTPWNTEMPFTGVALQPSTDDFELELQLPAPASKLRLHTRGKQFEIKGLSADSTQIPFALHTDSYGLTIIEPRQPLANLRLHLGGDCSSVIGGIELFADSTGTVVHSIGNNGATFSSYGMIDRFGSDFAALEADLVIIAMGTNEAFGRTTVDELRTNINSLVESIRTYTPQAKIMLVGPAECYKRRYVRRKGRRRSSQVINQKAATMARAIRLYAEEHGLPYYNHYAVAGRASSLRNAHLLSKDGVHYTRTGYRLWGNLLADALLEKLQ